MRLGLELVRVGHLRLGVIHLAIEFDENGGVNPAEDGIGSY